ncbi:MAG: triose-phosphate isomerase [Phycisphaerae bacterium]|nr:triose-phosphate isomerase [Phycisphaerae bacterium]
MRKKYVAGNWKMNLTLADAKALVQGIAAGMPANAGVDVAVFPPFVLLHPLAAVIGGSIQLGAQNCHYEASGAFTGEIAPQMLLDVGCKSVIIGHSERRHIFGETEELLKKKVMAALKVGLKVIYCVGEKLDEREAGQTEAVLHRQIHKVLGADVPLDEVTIAYEPVWAIGTGKTASPQQAQDAHAYIRGQIGKLYNAKAAEAVRIQYGGSVKASNARELLGQPDVDGALVGGASLKADEFLGIIKGAQPA